MSPAKIEKSTAWFMLTIGLINILVWPLIIISTGIPDFGSNYLAYVFHWFSELTMAVLLIISGIMYMKNYKAYKNFRSLALGLLSISITGALYYYIINFEIPMFIMSSVISVLTLTVILLSCKTKLDLLFLVLGISIYGLINLTGDHLQQSNINMLFMCFPALVSLIIITSVIINRNVKIINY